jgi:hypothetical protein
VRDRETAPADTSRVGLRSAAVTGTDVAGMTGSANCPFEVSYDFVGWLPPVVGDGVTVVKAGRNVALKWRLRDGLGAPVANLRRATVSSVQHPCGALPTGDAVPEQGLRSTGLRYLGDGAYQLNWKTPTSHAKSCRTLLLDLGEVSPRTAEFRFR